MDHTKASSALEMVPLDLLREPLVWFFAEHYRHREVCKRLLQQLESDEPDTGTLQVIHDFLENDMHVHIRDEEDDFFPLLRDRCEPEDHIDHVLDILSGEHLHDMLGALKVRTLIAEALSGGRSLLSFQQARSVIEQFCSTQKRHIAVENAVVLPIARMRILETDYEELGQRLAARRGLPDPFAWRR